MAAAKIVLSSLVVAALVVAGLSLSKRRDPDACRLPAAVATVTTGSRELRVAIAATPAEQRRGLSGCKRLPANTGLYFPLGERVKPAFWMKDMVIPIDVVWLAGDAVIGVSDNIPPPQPGVPDEELPRYDPPAPVTAVLEVAAGEAQRLGLDVGRQVLLK